jgi:hypothetical protein
MSDTNLRVWSALEKTNPKHTKPFKRSGGFSGTAVKPIYNDERMTEAFGPCGIGWGIGKPEYTMVNSGDGAVIVYCVAEIWFMDGDKRSEPIYGVGGDFAVAKRSSGTFADDEAFKKAFTDAVGNAMKRLGMSADIHMGLFDDHKYVQERAREEAAEEREEAPRREPQRQPPAQQSAPAEQQQSWRKPDRPAEIPVPRVAGKLDLKEWLTMLMHALSQSRSTPEVKEWLKLNGPTLTALKTDAPKFHARVMDYAASLEAEMSANPMAA